MICVLLFLLLDQLGSDSYFHREGVSKILEVLDTPVIYYVGMSHPDLEVRKRSEFLLEDWSKVNPVDYPVLPWIDMLPDDWPDRLKVLNCYLGDARNLIGWNGSEWPDYRQATGFYVVYLRQQGWDRNRIQKLLDSMVIREKEYRKKNGLAALP